MARVHWDRNNNFIHYGGAGLDMFQLLGYSADSDDSLSGQSSLGLCFDDPAEDSTIAALTEQIPQIVYASDDGISFGELFLTTCNTTPADSEKYRVALGNLIAHKEVIVKGRAGQHRRKATTITEKDQIIRSPQTSFGF